MPAHQPQPQHRSIASSPAITTTTRMPFRLSVRMSVCLSVCRFICLPVSLSVCLSVGPSVSPSICLQCMQNERVEQGEARPGLVDPVGKAAQPGHLSAKGTEAEAEANARYTLSLLHSQWSW